MLEAAVAGVLEEARRLRVARPLVLGVTVLTSVGGATASRVLALARDAAAAGCDGVVASAQEATLIRKRFGRRLQIVCPGIRPKEAARGDQQRVCTPAEAMARGADWLVIGRPITEARDPRQALRGILQEMEVFQAC
jgi:orotidine-5'-phosphate decarboxylase